MSAGGVSRALLVALVVVLVAAYPFALVAGLDLVSARALGVLLLALTTGAAVLAGGRASRLVPLLLRRFGLLVAAAIAAAATNHPVALMLLPSLTSLWLLVTFAASLRRGPSVVEQFATAMHDGFPDFLLPYCRKVTWMWCGFFAINAVVGAVLALAASPPIWALYTGVLAYLAVAGLAAGEYVFHKTRFRFYESGWSDRLWRRLCPPERTELGRRTLAWQLAKSGKPGTTSSDVPLKKPVPVPGFSGGEERAG